MTVQGVDYSYGRPNLDQLWNGGYRFVSRYLSWINPTTVGKVINKAEATALLDHGFKVFLNWEYDARDALGGGSAGSQHATEAVNQAKNLGYPKGATLYFSVDFDVTPAQKPVMNAYLAAAKRVVN